MDLSPVRTLLLSRYPFLGFVALETPVEADYGMGYIAAAGEHRIYINPSLWEKREREDQAFIFAHEVLHFALDHPTRGVGKRKAVWQIAADVMVNEILIESGMTAPSDAVTWSKVRDRLSLPLDDRPNLSVEELYLLLLPYADKLDTPPLDLIIPAGPVKPRSKAGIVAAALSKTFGLGWGLIPGSLARSIAQDRKPIAWEMILLLFIGTLLQRERSFRRPNRRHLWRGAVLPSGSGQQRINLVVCIDASGSISDDQLAVAFGAIRSLDIDFYLIVHDVDVCMAGPYRGDLPPSIVSGGGTSFIAAMEHAAKQNPDGVVWFTDGHGDYPDEPEFPVLWLMTTKSFKRPPFGWVWLIA